MIFSTFKLNHTGIEVDNVTIKIQISNGDTDIIHILFKK